MHTELQEPAMEATVAERGQITLPKAVRDALGLTKGTLLKVELDGSRIILRKNVDDAISRARSAAARRAIRSSREELESGTGSGRRGTLLRSWPPDLPFGQVLLLYFVPQSAPPA
jgi:antitoxin PrlF